MPLWEEMIQKLISGLLYCDRQDRWFQLNEEAFYNTHFHRLISASFLEQKHCLHGLKSFEVAATCWGTHQPHCSTSSLQQPSHCRPPRLQPGESLPTQNICHSAAVSSRGKTQRSSWLRDETLTPSFSSARSSNFVSRFASSIPGGRCCSLAIPRIIMIPARESPPGGSHPANTNYNNNK